MSEDSLTPRNSNGNSSHGQHHGKGTPDDPLEPDEIYEPGEDPRARRSSSSGEYVYASYDSSNPNGTVFEEGTFGDGPNSFRAVYNDHPLLKAAAKSLNWLLGAGILAIVLGIVVAVWPHASITVFSWAVGIFSVVVGAALIYTGIANKTIPIIPSIGAFFGVLFVLAGIGAMISPETLGAFIMIMLGFMILFEGFASLGTGRMIAQFSGSSYFIWEGVLSIILGFVFIFAPMTSLYGVTIVLGIFLAAFGLLVLIGAIRGKRFLKDKLHS